MPTLLLYLAAAIVLIAAWHRWVTPLSRGAAAVLLLLPFLFAGPALVTNRAYGGYDIFFLSQPFGDYAAEHGFERAHNGLLVDHVLQLAPWQAQVRRSFANGEWPLWNPSILSGQVLAGAMQAAPYDPLNLIALLLPLDLATAFGAAMTLFLAALFTFAFARELECSEGASLVAAAGFALSSAMAFDAGWPLGRAWTMLPFVLLAVRRVVHRRDTASFALLTIALTLLIFCGHPETLLHVTALGLVYGVLELFAARRDWWRAVALAAGSGIVALLLTAIFLLPFVALLGSSREYDLRKHAAFAASAEVWKSVRATFLPYYGGASWHTLTSEWDFATARVGSVVLALAAIACIRLWRRREVRFLMIAGAVAMLANWKAWPVAQALRALPLFEITLNERLGIFAVLALSLLAAKAFDAALQRDRTIAIGVAAVLTVMTLLFWQRQLAAGADRRLLLAGAVAELIGIVLLVVALSTSSRRIALALVLVGLCGQRFVEESNIYPALPRAMFYPSTPLLDAIPRDPLYRVTATGNLLVPNVAAMYGLEDVRGYDALTYLPYAETMRLWCPDARRAYHDVTDLSRPFLSFLGVRHALTPRAMEPPPGWRVVADDRTTRLLENTRAIPRVFVPRRIRYVGNHATALDEMAAATDFAETAWIQAEGMTPHESANGDATLQARRIGSSEYEIDVDAQSPARVVIAETSWPGWRAYVHGRRVEMAVANRAFLSVWVPSGKHRLRVVYLPDAFVHGRAISLATLALLGIAIGVRQWRLKPNMTPRLPTSRNAWIYAVIALSALALVRVASTHRVFSATADEPVHIASGYDFITRGAYLLDPEHPPLARSLFGLGMRMAGVVSPPPPEWKSLQPVWAASARGTELLWQNANYLRNLSSARAGNLLFLLAALLAVALWARRTFGTSAAVVAVALFGALPPILAHAGVATTDMAVTAALPLALLALEWWLERPTRFRAIALGLAIGIGLGTKLSFALFFLVAGSIVVALSLARRSPRPRVASALLAIAMAVAMLWSVYGFERNTLAGVAPVMKDVMRDSAGAPGAWIAEHIPLPAPTYLVGLAYVRVHQQRGHPGFLLGERSDDGWWFYFPVAVFLKTPLPFLILFLIGAAILVARAIRERSTIAIQHVLIPIALLLTVMPANLNVGVRHVLVVYPSMAIVAAFAACELWRAKRNLLGRGAVAMLLGWLVIGTSRAHPDYLAWFNEIAGPHPEQLLVDSNLDWGQDVLRLAAVAREEKIDRMSVLLFGSGDVDRIGLPPHQPLIPGVPTQGWVAVSETALQYAAANDFAWLRNQRPLRRVGKSIRLYYIP